VFTIANKIFIIKNKIMMNKVLSTVLIASVTSLATFAAAKKFIYRDTPFFKNTPTEASFHQTSYNTNEGGTLGGYTDLESAAAASVKSVVHVKVNTKAQVVQTQSPFGSDDFFGQFFGGGRQYIPQGQSSGSGVVVSADGYIVTNNHVVENANDITVSFNDKNAMKAVVVGKDASTDLALLKVEATNLPALNFGNSDNVRLGQWVLAVGYPLNLETTVTAGIVSAKSRSIGIHAQKSKSAIESFIQTDAAVNPGNSGGALVDAEGNLIGINSAIASPTGSYAGYSYAIPSNLVKKVIEDLKKYGNVQRGYLGINPMSAKDAAPEEISAYHLDNINGVYVAAVNKGSGADDAGLKDGDIITKINGFAVSTTPELLEQVGRYSPGNKIDVTYTRAGKEITAKVELKNINGNTKIVKNEYATKLAASFRSLSKEESRKLGIQGGVLVTNVGSGELAQTQMKRNFIITAVNEENVNTVEQLNNEVNSSDGKVQFSGLYPGYQGVYYYEVDLK
jgi:Do/DeqQ family serine protease